MTKAPAQGPKQSSRPSTDSAKQDERGNALFGMARRGLSGWHAPRAGLLVYYYRAGYHTDGVTNVFTTAQPT